MKIIMMLGAVLCFDAFVSPCGGQPVGAARPRYLVDSSYAVRLQLDRLAEMIRRGAIDERALPSFPNLSLAVATLGTVGAQRRTAPPLPSLGPLWDFQFDSVVVSAEVTGLRVNAKARLASDSKSATPVSLLFQREGSDWALADYGNLDKALGNMTARLQGGQTQ